MAHGKIGSLGREGNTKTIRFEVIARLLRRPLSQYTIFGQYLQEQDKQ